MHTPAPIPNSIRTALPLAGAAAIALSLLMSPGANASSLGLTDTVTYSGTTAVANSTSNFASTTLSPTVSFTLGNSFNGPALSNFPSSIAMGTGDGSGWNFYDDYVFTVGASSVQSAVISFNSVLGGIGDLQARIFSTTAPYSSSLATSNLTNPPANGSVVDDAWATMNTNNVYTADLAATLAPGTYDLQIRGEVAANGTGSYGGGITFNTVPLPAAVWLMLSGLVGFAGLARRSKA